MSEIIGTARVVIRPDTSTFATELKADVVAAAAAASASATSAAKSASSAAKEAGVSVRGLVTATTALTQAQNANARAAKAAALAVGQIAGVTGNLAIAQERAARASALSLAASKAVEKSKLAVAAAEKIHAVAIAAGNDAVTASIERSVQAARGAHALAEANLAAAQSHEIKAKAAIDDARAEGLAAKSSTGFLKGNLAAAATAFAAGSGGKGVKQSAEAARALAAQTVATGKLSFAQRAVVVTTTELAAAQEGARRAQAAVTAAEVFHTAALEAKNAKLIQSAEATLNDARVKQKAALSSERLALADAAQLSVKDKLDNVTRKAAGVTSELAAAQIRASRAAAAALASEEALEFALATGNRERVIAAQQTNALAIAQEREAITALEAAKAQQIHSSQLAFARRGVLASALAFTGLRGATLAANTAFILGAAALITFAKSLSVATQFETQLNVFRVTTGATADEMERMSAVAVQLGADLTLPGVSAGDAAAAMTELAKAGLSVEDAIAGARGVLQLSTAANISQADAVQLAASALNAFGLAGDQAVRVADVLANAANQAQGSIQDMGLSLQQAAAVGRQVGLSLEDTAVLLTALQRAGIRGSDAGTSLRTALIRLINPTKKVRDVLAELGLVLRDQEGNIRPDFFVNLGIALQGLSKEEKDAKIAILGGADAIRSLSILSRQSIGDLIGLRQEIRNQGTAADVASARTAGLAGAGKALQNVLENVGLSLGQRVTPGLTNFVNGLSGAVASVSANQAVIGPLSDSLNAAGDAFNLLGAAISVTLPLVGAFVSATAAVGQGIGVAEILGAVAAYKFLGPAVLAAGTAIRSFAVSAAAANVGIMSMSANLKFTGAVGIASALTKARIAALAFATSATGVGIAVAALAGGLIYLATRESATEQATRNLKSALDSLDGSMAAVTATAETLARATSSIATERLASQSAKLAAEQAKLALSGSQAAKGSLERAQLENALKVSLDNVRLAEERLRATRLAQADAAAELQIRQANVREDREKEAEAVAKLTNEIRKEILARQFRLSGRGSSEAGRVLAVQIEQRGIQDLIETLRERAAEEAKGADANSRANARRLEALADVVAVESVLPNDHQIELFLKADTLKEGLRAIAPQFNITGKESIDAFIKGIVSGLGKSDFKFILGPEIFANLNAQWEAAGAKDANDYWQAFIDAGKASKDKIAAAFQKNLESANASIAAAEGAALDQRISGAFTPQAQLQNLLQKRAGQEKALAATKKKFSVGTATQDEVTAAKEELADTADAITALQESIRSDAESAAREIQDAKDKADQAVIDAFTGGKRRTRLENLLLRAQRTEGLGDDIKFNKALVVLLRNQIKQAADRIKNLEKRRDFIRDTNKLIITITNQIKSNEAEQRNLLRQQREDRAAEVLSRIDADIEFAQIREDARAEIKARNARIKALQAQQRALVKEKGQRAKNTAEYKNLRNQIAQEKKAIAELRDEQKEASAEAQKLIFEFLQTQQGFAANLLGNLIPTNATEGLVGGSAAGGGAAGSPIRDPGQGVAQARALAQARTQTVPTAGQANTEIDVLRQILRELRHFNKGYSHPEAKNERQSRNSAMDVVGN